jgi:Cu(I)/Ag(I) efflux system membrane fusion protein
MPLIRAVGAESSGTGSEPMLELSDHARAMAAVETTIVQRRKLAREIRAVGKVEYNETAMANITVRVEGYVERLFVDYTGIEVMAGDTWWRL